MKPLTLFIAISLLFFQQVKSQDHAMAAKSIDTPAKSKPFNLSLKLYHAKGIAGYLVTIRDSAMFVSMTPAPINFNHANIEYLQKINYSAINIAKLYNRKKTTTTFLICLFSGIAAGALIGYSGGDDTGWFALTAGGKAVVGGIVGAGAGSLVGAIAIQGMQKKFYIKGEWKNLQEMKESLRQGK